MTHRPRTWTPLLAAWLAACTDRPFPADTEAATSTVEPGDTGAPPSVPTTTASPPPATTTTTTVPPGTTTDSTDDGTDSTGAPSPPLTPCGACPATWESPGEIEITPATDVSTFDCLSVIHGALSITGDLTAAQLAALANVTQVEGWLLISGNAVLTDLSPFVCLREIEGLSLADLPALTDATGLSSLEVCAGGMQIDATSLAALPVMGPNFHGVDMLWLIANPALVDLTPAAGWTPDLTLFDLAVHNNAALTSLDGLQPFAAIADDIWISSSPALTDLTGLETLFDNNVKLSGLPQLSDLLPLADVQHVRDLVLDDLPGLSSLVGLHGIQSAGTISIGDCSPNVGLDGLTDLTGLGGLTSLGTLALFDNEALSSFAGLDALTELVSLTALENPQLSPVVMDAFLAQFDPPPGTCLDCGVCLDDDGSH